MSRENDGERGGGGEWTEGDGDEGGWRAIERGMDGGTRKRDRQEAIYDGW